MTRIPLRDVGEVVSPLGEHVLVSDEVAAALAAAQPVVALETSLVTHGLPYPHCVDVSVDAAGRIRAGGGVHRGAAGDVRRSLSGTLDSVHLIHRRGS